jgi:hypothetical protein
VPSWFSQGLYRVDPASDPGQTNREHDVNPLGTIARFRVTVTTQAPRWRRRTK